MIQRPATIGTERLRLVVLLPDEVHALLVGDSVRASRLAGITFAPGWPEEGEARDGLQWHLRHLRADARHIPWRIRAIVEHASSAVVGSINLKGPPDPLGDVEIGWGLMSAFRGRGYAVEAAAAVLQWVTAQPGVTSVSATIPTENLPSQRLAAKLGMVLTGEIRRTLPVWRSAPGQSRAG